MCYFYLSRFIFRLMLLWIWIWILIEVISVLCLCYMCVSTLFRLFKLLIKFFTFSLFDVAFFILRGQSRSLCILCGIKRLAFVVEPRSLKVRKSHIVWFHSLSWLRRWRILSRICFRLIDFNIHNIVQVMLDVIFNCINFIKLLLLFLQTSSLGIVRWHTLTFSIWIQSLSSGLSSLF